MIFHTYNTIPDSDVNLCSTPEGSLCLLPIGNSMYNNHYFNLHVYKDLLDSFYRIRTIQNVLFSICLLSLIIYRSDIHHSRILYDPPLRILEIKAKINKWPTWLVSNFLVRPASS